MYRDGQAGRMSDHHRNRRFLLVVLGLIAASALVITTQRTILGLDLRGGVQLVYQAEPNGQNKVTTASLSRTVDIMNSRVDQLGVSQPEIQTDGFQQISVGLPDISNITRAEHEVGTTAMLYFYDWEADALTPNGQTVAAQLLSQDQNAVAISQGNGLPGDGSMNLYDAVTLASRQPPTAYRIMSRKGPQYYLFGPPGSVAGATAARDAGQTTIPGQHCLLSRSGIPDNEPPGTSLATATQHLYEDLPAGITP